MQTRGPGPSDRDDTLTAARHVEEAAVLNSWGVQVMRGHAVLSDAEQTAHEAGRRAGVLGADQPDRMRALGMLTSARERVGYVVGYGQGRVEVEDRP